MARVCIIRQGFYPLDTRIRRAVHALTAAGHGVDVICVARSGQPWRVRRGNAAAYRVPLKLERRGRLRYLFQYAAFLVAAVLLTGLLQIRGRWDVVAVHSMPDGLVFAAAIPRRFGARVLLDLHKCMSEFFATKYRLGMDHPAVRIVSAIEQASIRFADRAITCTDQMREAFVSRGAPRPKIDVVLNAADEEIFDARRHPPERRRPDRFGLICPGAIEESYGVDTNVRATALLRDEIPGLSVDFYGDGSYRAELKRFARELGVDGAVRVSDGWTPMEELLEAIAGAGVGVVAVKRTAFRELTHCNKMFDFIAMRRPAIVSRTQSVEAYFARSCFLLFESGDARDLAQAIRTLDRDPVLGDRLIRRAAERSEPYRWSRQRGLYAEAVEALVCLNGQPCS